MTADRLRTVRLSPYRPGMGPRFTLAMWDTGRRDGRGQACIGYRLTLHRGPGKLGPARVVVFEGEDFSGSPLHADDSDATVGALLEFLTLRPGDTDAEYFERYTDVQRVFCAEHAETFSAYVEARFGER